MHFWGGGKVHWLSFVTFIVNQWCDQDIFALVTTIHRAMLWPVISRCFPALQQTETPTESRGKTGRDFSSWQVRLVRSGRISSFVAFLPRLNIHWHRRSYCKNYILKLDIRHVWVGISGKFWRFAFKCCELEAEQTLALCELDTNWTPELSLNAQSVGEYQYNLHQSVV